MDTHVITDPSTLAVNLMAKAIAAEVLPILREAMTSQGATIRPALLDVKQAATYLGRSEQAMQHLISQRDIPVVRVGRRVHLHLVDLDAWIEKNKADIS